MSMIKVEHLTFAYPGGYVNVFEDVSFQLDTDWKLGLVGRNGRGKTTLLRLLMGEYEHEGTISAAVEFDYFPYPVKEPERLTEEVLEEVCPGVERWRLLRELGLLEVDEGVLWRGFDTLSNGERTKVLLAALFCNEGHFLLIDEPTNHLDSRGREMVERYLDRKKGFILVSHDRRFLDGCVDHILSINRSDIQLLRGDFSSWWEEFETRQTAEEAQSQRLRQDVKRLKEAARRTSDWSDRVEASKVGGYDKGYIGHKSAKMMKRSKAIQARQERAIEEKEGLLKNRETAEELKLSPLMYHSRRLVRFEEVAVRYGDRVVNEPVSFAVEQGERIALEGGNGSGKSSLLKLLLGEEIGHTGRVEVGSGLVISHVSQDTGHLKGSLTEYARGLGIDESLLKAILRKLGFERVQFEKDMEEYSGGQKKKVLIAGSLCERAHLYVWDEPLNFMDVYSRVQIEELIRRFGPTMVFVEHDRAFREGVATGRVVVR